MVHLRRRRTTLLAALRFPVVPPWKVDYLDREQPSLHGRMTTPQSSTPPTRGSALERLKRGDASRWPNIADARSFTQTQLPLLVEIVGDLLPRDEGSLVVFGSLARGEFTAGSDLDWTLMIDGRADSGHLEIAHKLRRRLVDASYADPGQTGVFGGLVFSHDLIHAIGGDEDTNKNMTRRLLLLLESIPISASEGDLVRERVLNGILYRYVNEDASFISSNKSNNRIPRFLLNDVVRFWRTMAVDYANKYRAREGQGWALRNIKLRMSRKLLFVSGLFMCFSWALDGQEDSGEQFLPQKLVSHLRDWTQRPPLESLAMIVESYAPDLATDIFDTYDSFLELLVDVDKRDILVQLSPDGAYTSDVFLEARDVATRFDDALVKLLFESDIRITQLTRKYGVF